MPVRVEAGTRATHVGWEVSRDKVADTGKDGTVSWTVIVPVKRLVAAKSRLRGTLDAVDHEALALAMALDTIAAALASPVVGRVVVVTADPMASEAAAAIGAHVVPDVPDAGLNPAIAYAATLVRPKGATASLPGVVALAADLAALRTAELTEALRLAEQVTALRAGETARSGRAFVADAAGTGTVLLAAGPGALLEPCFGLDSAAAHAASGATPLIGDWPSLRRDVDTAADLAEAFLLGVGPRTAAATLTGPTTMPTTVPTTVEPIGG
jgi:2-phospho-L-lactate/phosphoenolpyruvate guanylyltransferase